MQALPHESCPLCGAPNGCAPAASGRLDTPCWCSDVHIAPDAIARVPEAARGRACLCPRCAAAPPPSDE